MSMERDGDGQDRENLPEVARGGPAEEPASEKEPEGDAIVRRADGTIALDDGQQELLEEVLEQANATNERIEAELMFFASFAFRRVFRRRTRAVLEEEKIPNAVWRELVRRAGGPTLQMTEETLRTSVRAVAWGKTINDENFTKLDLERKKLLLPLDDAERLRKAAQHVIDNKLSYRATEKYVRSLRATAGDEPEVRLTPRRIDSRTEDIVATFGSREGLKAVARVAESLDEEARQQMAKKLDRAIAALTKARAKFAR